MITQAKLVLCTSLLLPIQLVQNVQTPETEETEVNLESYKTQTLTRLARSPSAVSMCRVCRGKPRKCKCYKYKKVGSRYKCSYSQKVDCDAIETTEAPNLFLKDDKSFQNMTLSEVCGRSRKVKVDASPRSIDGKPVRVARQGRIINGTKALFASWPWQISLRQWNRFKGSYLHKCGAALLSEEWAITAAHCVHREDHTKILLILGEHDIYNDREPFAMEGRKLKQIKVHPKFNPQSFENDLALLKLISPVKYQANILPACVPRDDQHLEGQEAWVTGWGKMKREGPLASVLQELEVPILSNRVCERMYRKSGHPQYIPHIFICAGYGEGGRDSCGGDSGGPLSVQRADGRFDIAGVVSWGIGCAEKNQPGVMARVSQYRDWILETIGE